MKQELNLLFELDSIGDIRDTVQRLLKETTPEITTKLIADAMGPRYKSYYADQASYQLKILFEDCQSVIESPEAHIPLFEMIIINGAVEVYNTFNKIICKPYVSKMDEDQAGDYYFDLYLKAQEMSDILFSRYHSIKKGTHFIGEVAELPSDPSYSIIAKEDYDAMELVIEAYNAIIGRKEILEDLESK